MIAALALTGCGKVSEESIKVDPALETLVPADTIFAFGIRMELLRGTETYKRQIANRRIPALDNLQRDFGLDARKDIREILIVSTGKDTVVMARGKFGEMGLEPKLEKQGAKRFGYKGYTLMGEEEAAVTFMTPSVAVAGPAPSVRKIIDGRRSNQGFPTWMKQKLNALPLPMHMWMIGDIGFWTEQFDPKSAGNAGNVLQFARLLKAVTMTADMTNGVKAELDGTANSEQDAKRLHDAARGLIGLARLGGAQNRPEFIKVLDGIRVDLNQKQVRITVDIPNALMDELGKLLG